MNNFLPTKSNLFQRKVVADILCPICIEGDETLQHMLLGCLWSGKVWFLSNLYYKHDLGMVSNFGGWFQKRFLEIMSHPDSNDTILLLLCFMVWNIWLGMNGCIFFFPKKLQIPLILFSLRGNYLRYVTFLSEGGPLGTSQ